jgi:hypothetical protein
MEFPNSVQSEYAFALLLTFMYWEIELTFCPCFRDETDKRNKDEPYLLDVLERETK